MNKNDLSRTAGFLCVAWLLPRFVLRLLLAAILASSLPLTAAYAAEPIEDAAAVLERATGAKPRSFSTRDFGRDKFPGARSVIVAPDSAEALLQSVRAKLPKGTFAFVGTQNSLADPPVEGAELVVAPGATQFDILRVAASDAVNYGMGTEDLIKTLQRWDKAYGIDIYAAQTDTIQLRLKTLPKDMRAFSKEVYEFCPDIVDQGIGTVEKLAAEIGRSKEVYLWWD